MSTTESYLIAVCQTCYKQYGILAEHISDKGGRFPCKHCGAMVTVRKGQMVSQAQAPSNDRTASTKARGTSNLPDWVHTVEHDRPAAKSFEGSSEQAIPAEISLPQTAFSTGRATEDSSATTELSPSLLEKTDEPTPTDVMNEPTVIRTIEAIPASADPPGVAQKSSYRFGLTGKFLLFTLIPLVIISALSLIYSIDRMLSFQKSTIEESTHIVKGISEGMLRQISTTVARQTRQYLFSHPDLKREHFNRDIYFKKVAIQRVGVTGNTSLYEIAGADGIWRAWADIDAKLVGVNLETLKNRLGEHFDAYWKLLTGVKEGKIVSGYYYWPDEGGQFREKYMVCTPVEGTPYAVSASIYVDEITVPLMKIEARGNALAGEMRNSIAAIMGGGLLLLALILFFYGRGLTRKIHTLSAWADRISLGELDLEGSPVTSKDELGELSEAIARMQDSIRLSVQRLRRRRH
jgi:HAMP domain-containing protein